MHDLVKKAVGQGRGYEGEVIGRTNRTPNKGRTGEIIGLVKDFNYRPLDEPIKPRVIRLGGGKLMIKMKSDDLWGTIARVDAIRKGQFGEFPLRYSFMDDNFDHLYTKENILQDHSIFFDPGRFYRPPRPPWFVELCHRKQEKENW